MTMATETNTTVQVFRVYIKATPQAIWDAITKPEWNERYGYRSRTEYDLQPGGAYRAITTPEMAAHGAPETIIEGEILESDPPHKLVQTWHAFFSAEIAAEPVTRLTWEITETEAGISQLTVTHDLHGAPNTAAIVTGTLADAGGGWSFILSDLKTLLETGTTLSG